MYLIYRLKDDEMAFLDEYTKKMCIGGRSSTRPDRQNRMAHLYEDNLVGQIGEYVTHRWWYPGGDTTHYHARMANPFTHGTGDGGCDLPGLPLDVKASPVRGDRALREYRLSVTARSYRPSWTYVLVLVDLAEQKAMLMGWQRAERLTLGRMTHDASPSWICSASELQPMSKRPHLTPVV